MIDDRRNRVLIVEDDPSIRRMLVVSLGREGYRTAEASNGPEALDVLRAGQADLVVLDLMMLEVTGHQVLAERAAEPELRKIPVIIITASRGDETARVLNEGIYALLPKPFDIETLNALVKSCLGQV